MMDINMMIANNILHILRKQGKNQMHLENGIGASRYAMSKMLNGEYTISAVELKKIADFLDVPMESIMQVPESPIETDVIHTLMGRVETEGAKEALRIADEVSDMINFHRKVRSNE